MYTGNVTGFCYEALWRIILGGPWDLVNTYNWAYNPTYNWGNPYKPI